MECIDESSEIVEIARNFRVLSARVPLHAIEDEAAYSHAVSVMNSLLDAGGANEKHELAGLVHVLGLLIAEYEGAHHQLAQATPVDMLRFMMEQHELRQSDLTEIGSQGVVSEVLSGKRDLNLRQARALAKRFHLPVSAFLKPA